LDSETLALKKHLPAAHENSVFTVRYASNHEQLVSGGRDAQLKVWSLTPKMPCISQQSAHWFTINSIAFHPRLPLFATASRDKTIKIWDAESFQLLKVLEGVRDQGHFNSVNKLYWNPSNSQLISCSDDRTILIWEMK